MLNLVDKFLLSNLFNFDTMDVGLEAVQYDKYYLDHGTRNASQLITLRKNSLETFTLPINSTLHLSDRDVTVLGVNQDDPLLRNLGDRICTDFIAHYKGDVLGAPIRLNRLIHNEVKPFLRTQKRLKYVRLAAGLKTLPMVPYAINYSPIDATYRYKAAVGVFYQRRYNYYQTVIQHVKEELENSTRQQFLTITVPSTIPSVTKLNELETGLLKSKDSRMFAEERFRKWVDNDGRFLISHFWYWMGENGHLSLFSLLPTDKLDRLNFLFVIADKYVLINAGKLRSFIRTADNQKGLFEPSKMKRVVLRMFMSLQQLASLQDDVEEVLDEEAFDEMVDTDTNSIKDEKLKNKVIKTREKIENGSAPPILDVNANTNGMKGDIDISAKARPKEPLNSGDQSDYVEMLLLETERDLEQLEIVEAQNDIREAEADKGYHSYKPLEDNHTAIIDEKIEAAAEKGLLTAAELRRMKNLARKFQNTRSPFDASQTLEEYSVITAEDLSLDEGRLMENVPKGMFDESQLNSRMKKFHEKYIDNVYRKDIINTLLHVQKAGVALTDVNMTRVDEYNGSYMVVTAQLTPVYGTPSTVKIKLPVLNSDGTFTSNGVTNKMALQRVDAPIRKVSWDTVSLTSYMSKMFVTRTERAQFNLDKWVIREINKRSMGDNTTISEIIYKDVSVTTAKFPRTYSMIAREIASFKFGNQYLYFDFENIEKNIPNDLLANIDRTKFIPFSFQRDKEADMVLAFGYDDLIYSITPFNGEATQLGTLLEFLEIDEEAAPIPYAEVGILAKTIPVGILLAHHIGFGNLLKTCGIKFRTVKRGSLLNLGKDEFTLKFENEVLIFKRNDYKATLLFNGFNRVKSVINKLNHYQLDSRDSYGRIFEALDIQPRYEKEYQFMFNTWVDHITKDLLIEMNEPTDLVLLFLSAIDKLADDQYNDPNGVEGSVLRGYQRIPGMIYSELFKAIRQYNNAPMSKNSKVELNPNAVWFSIIQDETVSGIEESNPIHAIKENEKIVFGGKGGRSSQSMTAKHRQFGRDNIGVVSEASVDNGKVGTITYLTADPNVLNLRGALKPLDNVSEAKPTQLQSTAMMLSAGSDTDD